jgi:hypothetical protein
MGNFVASIARDAKAIPEARSGGGAFYIAKRLAHPVYRSKLLDSYNKLLQISGYPGSLGSPRI